jgi:hypothetical protein
MKARDVMTVNEMIEIITSGYGGILSGGEIVDRRQHPEAMPIQANKLLGVPEPKERRHAEEDE